MAIDRANKPYDPSNNKPGATGNTEGIPTYRPTTAPPPKAGISGGLLAWVLAGAAITGFIVITLVLTYK
jgi:hypothetical protein